MKKYIIAGAVIFLLAAVIVGVKLQQPDKVAAPAVATAGSYVALGDSVAAGVGLKTDSDVSACNRTDESYPHQAASALNYKLTNLACSGATIPAGINGPQDVNGLMAKPQLDQLFAQSTRPKLISLTVGANDANWTTVFAKCYTGICGSAEDTAGVKQRLALVSTNLQKALTQIQQHYGTNPPRVVVTGYHQVFPASVATNCADLAGVDANELVWGRQQQAAINDVIQSSVKTYAFARYAPVDFSGHELCTSDPWVQGLTDKQPYHPTEAGQTAFAQQIETIAKDSK
jgi:lysophospholipase L1-like esterase